MMNSGISKQEMKEMSYEIARNYKIPGKRKFGKTPGYYLMDVYKDKLSALQFAKRRREGGKWMVRVVRVIKPHGSLRRTPYKAPDYYEYAIYARPKEGWNLISNNEKTRR